MINFFPLPQNLINREAWGYTYNAGCVAVLCVVTPLQQPKLIYQ